MATMTRTIGSSKKVNKTNVALWVTQGLLAATFFFAGASKLVMSGEDMTSQMDLGIPVWFLRFIGVCEVAGALGLILPSVSRIRTGLTALAACGLAVIMAGAVTTTAIAMDVPSASFPLVVGLLAAFVACGRTYWAPIADR
jgi:putative oxidoreductase